MNTSPAYFVAESSVSKTVLVLSEDVIYTKSRKYTLIWILHLWLIAQIL